MARWATGRSTGLASLLMFSASACLTTFQTSPPNFRSVFTADGSSTICPPLPYRTRTSIPLPDQVDATPCGPRSRASGARVVPGLRRPFSIPVAAKGSRGPAGASGRRNAVTDTRSPARDPRRKGTRNPFPTRFPASPDVRHLAGRPPRRPTAASWPPARFRRTAERFGAPGIRVIRPAAAPARGVTVGLDAAGANCLQAPGFGKTMRKRWKTSCGLWLYSDSARTDGSDEWHEW